jgi:transposase
MENKTNRRYGVSKDAALFAQERNLSCPAAAKMFGVPKNSIYHAARRMGFKLPPATQPKSNKATI